MQPTLAPVDSNVSSFNAVHLMRTLADNHSAGSSARARLRASSEDKSGKLPNHISTLATVAKHKLSLDIEYGSPRFSLPDYDSLETLHTLLSTTPQ